MDSTIHDLVQKQSILYHETVEKFFRLLGINEQNAHLVTQVCFQHVVTQDLNIREYYFNEIKIARIRDGIKSEDGKLIYTVECEVVKPEEQIRGDPSIFIDEICNIPATGDFAKHIEFLQKMVIEKFNIPKGVIDGPTRYKSSLNDECSNAPTKDG